MSRKTLATVLLITLAFALAPTAGASSAPDFPVPDRGYPAEAGQADDLVLAAAIGGTKWSCIGGVLAFSFTALAAAAATGGVGLAVVGAYAPVALVLCS